MEIYNVDLNKTSLKTLTTREVQQICLNMHEIILTHLQNGLFRGSRRIQLQTAEYRRTVQQYFSAIGEALDLQTDPPLVLQVLRAHMYFETPTDTGVQVYMDMIDRDLKTIGPYGLLDLLMKLMNATLDCLGDAIMIHSPDHTYVIQQCLNESRERNFILYDTVMEEYEEEENFLVDPNLILDKVILQVEILYHLP